MKKIEHPEAFCHMTYKSADGSKLMVWNSRDGVTPFIIYVDGKEYHHVDWENDHGDIGYIPVLNDRIFISHTFDTMLEEADEWYEMFMNEDPEDFGSSFPGSKQEVCKKQAEKWLTEHGEPPPNMIIVTKEFLAGFLAGRQPFYSAID